MKYHGRRALALVLSAILIASTASTAFAQEPVEKDEVVYVNLSHDGAVESIYVVNAYDMTQEQSVTDFGDYREVKNLTTTEELSVKDGSVSFTAPKGKFYYQGELDTAQIPWLVTMTYQLDGQPISDGDLAGKQGHLEMTLSLRQNPDANPVYFDNFAIQATVLLDSERCKNITAPNATLANVGGNKQMSYIVLPGKEKDFTISADVTDFEMDAIQINGIPLTLDIDDPDTTEIKDKIYELKDGAKELDDGAFRLDDGATQLQDGALELKDGASDLYDGTDELYDGVKELDEGADKLRSGSGELKDGADKLKAGFDQLNQSSRELKAGIAATQQQMAATLGIQLPSAPSDPLDTAYLLQVGMTLDKGFGQAISKVEAAIKQLEGAGSSIDLATLAPDITVRVLSAAVSVDEDGSISEEDPKDTAAGDSSEENSTEESVGDNSGEGSTEESSGDISGESSTGESSGDISSESSTEEGSGDISGESSTEEGSGDNSDGSSPEGNPLPEDSQTPPPADETGTPNSSPAQPPRENPPARHDSPADPTSQLIALKAQLASLNQFKQVNTLCMGTLQYMAGTEQLSAGYTSLYSGILELRSGIQELVGGVQELLDGSKELYDGASDLRDGVDELFDGTSELKDGTIELTDGTAELREQSDDMDAKVDEEIDKMLEEYRGSDFDMVSFVSDKNTQVDSVQFVMKVAEIQIEEEEAPVIQEEAKPSFWQKLINLFR